MEGIKVYNKDGKQIHPITHASATISDVLSESGNVEECLSDLYKKIGILTNDESTLSNLTVNTAYKGFNTTLLSEVKKYDNDNGGVGWGDFTMPTQKLQYTWKKTIYSYKGNTEPKITYEIIAMYPEIEQIIYKNTDSSKAPELKYVYGPDGKPTEDSIQNINFAEQGWSTTPQALSAAQPNAYMRIRTKNLETGKWNEFGPAILYGRWAFDSQLEIRYAVSKDISSPPTLVHTDEDPEGWSLEVTNEFTGYLWIITATSINGVYNTYKHEDKNYIWRGPNLISKL